MQLPRLEPMFLQSEFERRPMHRIRIKNLRWNQQRHSDIAIPEWVIEANSMLFNPSSPWCKS
jgi:hypothetical protein